MYIIYVTYKKREREKRDRDYDFMVQGRQGVLVYRGTEETMSM